MKKVRGKIIVYSVLLSKEGTGIKGVKMNLYKLNGLYPKLVSSKYTDEDGKVIFYELEDGSYRVIELIDRNYFQKPSYSKWNEVSIDEFNREGFKPAQVTQYENFNFKGYVFDANNLHVEDKIVNAKVYSELVTSGDRGFPQCSFKYSVSNGPNYNIATREQETLEQTLTDPQGLNYSDNENLVDSAEKYGRKVFASLRQEYSNEYQRARSNLEQSLVGDKNLVEAKK